jgi:hypothetical protein
MLVLCILVLKAFAEAQQVSYLPRAGTPPSPRGHSGIAYDSRANKVYIYGGKTDVILSDTWEFDLNSQVWSQVHPSGTMNPGGRSNSLLIMLEESRQIILFGGDTESGPVLDVWVYDIDSEDVRPI